MNMLYKEGRIIVSLSHVYCNGEQGGIVKGDELISNKKDARAVKKRRM